MAQKVQVILVDQNDLPVANGLVLWAVTAHGEEFED